MNRLLNKISLSFSIATLCLVATQANADISVDKSNGILSITSDIEGTVNAKVIGPDDKVVVDESFIGSSFSWAPSSGPDGAYRYDVRMTHKVLNKGDENETNVLLANAKYKSDYAGGSLEVKNGQIAMTEEAVQ